MDWTDIKKNNILTDTKIEIAKHYAIKKVLIGAKNSGKTFLAEIDCLLQMENNYNLHTWGLRKYKHQANQQLADYFFKCINTIINNNLEIKYNWKQVSRGQKISNNKYKIKTFQNQTMNFGSLEVQDTTNGWAPADGGYCARVIIDEPITAQDLIKQNVTTKEEFEQQIEIIRDDLSRHHQEFADTHPNITPVPYQEYFCMNPWWDHPLLKEANENFPEDKFIYYMFQYNKDKEDSKITLEDLFNDPNLLEKWFNDESNLKRLKENNTMSVYKKELDTLFVRMTKFANPNNCIDKKFSDLIKEIKIAFYLGNRNKLCILLGLQHKPELNKDMLVYNIPNFNNTTLEELKKDNWDIDSLCYSVDIDTSRVFTITPAFALTKKIINGITIELHSTIFIDKQIEIPAYGTGVSGEMNEIYVKNIAKKIKNHFNDLKLNPILLNKFHLAVDDKRKWYLLALKRELETIIKTFDTFQQHGDYNIIARQDWTTLGFNHNVLMNHIDNKALENDIEVCQRADVASSKRATTGNTNYLDRIDSMENAFIPFYMIILSSTKD